MGIYEITLISWGSVFLICLIIEFMTTDFGSICFAVGALFVFVFAAIPVIPFWVSIIVFFIVSVFLLIIVQKYIKKRIIPKNEAVTVTDHMVGKSFKLLTNITPTSNGTIKSGDIIWECRCEDDNQSVNEGSFVEVIRVDGNKMIVKLGGNNNV